MLLCFIFWGERIVIMIFKKYKDCPLDIIQQNIT